MSELTEQKLLDFLWDFWSWTKAGYKKAGLEVSVDMERAYKQMRDMIEECWESIYGHDKEMPQERQEKKG